MQDFFYIAVDRCCIRINFSELKYVLSTDKGRYLKVVTDNKVYLTRGTLRLLERMLPADQFCKVNHATIVAIPRVESFCSRMVNMGKDKFEFTLKYRTEFRSRVNILGVDPAIKSKMINFPSDFVKEVTLS